MREGLHSWHRLERTSEALFELCATTSAWLTASIERVHSATSCFDTSALPLPHRCMSLMYLAQHRYLDISLLSSLGFGTTGIIAGELFILALAHTRQ